MKKRYWFRLKAPLDRSQKIVLALFSFVLPLAFWCLVSYVPWIWHPYIMVADAGEVTAFSAESLVEREFFDAENALASQEGRKQASGFAANPVFLPAPHEVAAAFVRAFTTPPRRDGEPWLHESLLHSLRIIIFGFILSSLVGIPLGILCGSYGFFRGLFEPFIEFFRYLPAPAFGALAVAIWGIDDGPKIAIIFIGTFFQQVLIVSNTASKLETVLVEAAQTMGAKRFQLLFKVVVPGIMPDLYRDQRILLGWAWTYLIVSEVVGTSTGITWFINQQAKYRIYDNVFAAIVIIGIIGILSDLLLAYFGKRLFRWRYARQGQGD